jgi:hypothetical protein
MTSGSTSAISTNIYSRLMRAQAEFPSIVTDQTADTGKYKYKYVSLGSVLNAVNPVLSKHGILVLQRIDKNASGEIAVYTTLRTTDDNEGMIVSMIPLAIPESKSGDPQAMGSAITYARRYSLITALGLAPDEDDDGAAARPADPKAAVAPPSPQDGGAIQRFDTKLVQAVQQRLLALWKAEPKLMVDKSITGALRFFKLYPDGRPVNDDDLRDLLKELEPRAT